jgi:circadian clock protein KaiC
MTQATNPRAATGIPGLDDILQGGLTRGRVFLLEGAPGTGKTSMALRFLIEGARAGERGLFVTLSESIPEIQATVSGFGWTLDKNIEIFEVMPPESVLAASNQQSLLYSSDLELGETIRSILQTVERHNPSRIVIDSLSEIRLLAENSLRYRRQILALKHIFTRLGATVVMLDDLTVETPDKTVHSVAHGVLRLEELAPDYGADRRRLRVTKYRAQSYRGGYHDFIIRSDGPHVYPRLVAAEHRHDLRREQLRSGIAGLDGLLGGGIETGSSSLLLGPAGSGKSLLSLQFVAQAVADGKRAALFLFDEELGLLFDRVKPLGYDLEAWRASGKVHIAQLDAAELSPGEFSSRVREAVEKLDAKVVVIDSLNGYQASMPQENSLILHIHELLQFLNRRGSSTFLTVAQHGLVGEMKSPVDVTYLADTVVLLRYFEAAGSVRKAISVIKKRTGRHEDTIREFWIDGGLKVGAPLIEFHGVLRGVPVLPDAAARAAAAGRASPG